MKLTPPFLEGVMLALGAAPHACAVIDAPRCETERAYTMDATHDWATRLLGGGPWSRQRRIFPLDWTGLRGVTGTEDALRDTLRSVARQRPGSPILVFRGLMSHLVNTDIEGVAASLGDGLGSDVLVLNESSLDEDWMDGWRRSHDALVAHARRPGGDPGPVVAGLCVFRQEGDERGNVLELRRLWRRAGLPAARWLMTGDPVPARGVDPSAPVLLFPYAGSDAPLPLPAGLAGTAAFLAEAGRRFGCEERAARVAALEARRAREAAAPFVARVLGGRSAAVVGDPFSALAMAQVLVELGVGVPIAFVLRRPVPDAPGRDALESLGARVVWDPDLAQAEAALTDLASRGLCHAVVGSALLRDSAVRAGLPYVEATAPHYLEHRSAPAPWLGPLGLVRTAERLSNAVLAFEHAGRVRERAGRAVSARPDAGDRSEV